jgi:hypothetical protein
MANLNRTDDISNQKQNFSAFQINVPNLTIFPVATIERGMVVTDCKVTMHGVSGTPALYLEVYRFQGSTGSASFIIGQSFVCQAFGTSGFLSYSLPASGSTLLNLMKGDVVVAVQAGGVGAATVITTVDLITQNLQDVKTWY